MAEIIDGKLVSENIRLALAKKIDEFKYETGITPGLAVIIVGSNPASLVYVRNKKRACEQVGINSYEIALPEDVIEDDLIDCIAELNANPEVHGILVQLPLPAHINEEKILNSINPDKDVDAFHPVNVGRILIGNYTFLPCTPAGIIDLLDYYGIDISSKKCVVVGRSNIVGKPMTHLLLERNGTVTVCHSRTKDIESEIKSADILVVAVGKPEFVKGSMIKPGAVVIDVGINRVADGKLVGDVEFSSAFEIASYITPVPGGVGPMTITTLLKNTLYAAKIAHNRNNSVNLV
jgi:methylenetetrahydrofolate dehydrogenase (NADP+)/methenyltetrahydrofolate cyclohydrolase